MIGWNIIRAIPQSSLIKINVTKINVVVNSHLLCIYCVFYFVIGKYDIQTRISACETESRMQQLFCRGKKKWDSSRNRFERRSTLSCLHAGDLDREILSPFKDHSTSFPLRMIK